MVKPKASWKGLDRKLFYPVTLKNVNISSMTYKPGCYTVMDYYNHTY